MNKHETFLILLFVALVCLRSSLYFTDVGNEFGVGASLVALIVCLTLLIVNE